VPLDEVIEAFSGMAFDPSGFCRVGDEGDDEVTAEIRSASSTIDLVMKILDWLFPSETNRALRGLTSCAWQEEFNMTTLPPREVSPSTSTGNGEAPPEKPKKIKVRGASICPKCGQATYIQDGKCKRCNNPSCGYKDGGCGE
jgi:ribonucleoside-diphosphate reductase alpha chain